MKKILVMLLLLVYAMMPSQAAEKPTLLFYCGITMVKPIKEIAGVIEKRHNCIIKISQGGSQDLYDSLKFSRQGDLYLPGSKSYRTQYLKDGLLLDTVEIGYNQAALFVRKGNPKKITSLDVLTNEAFDSILCNPKSGSIGKMTKKILTAYKGEEFMESSYDNAVLIGTDSRNLNRALIDKKVDVTINWRATGFWPENAPYVDVIDLNSTVAPRKKLLINLLSFSKHKTIAKALMKFAASPEGQAIMKKYGFAD